MLKRLKWLLIATTAILVVTLTYAILVVRYAEAEMTAIQGYADSLLALNDVEALHSIHRFNGLESYIVANVLHSTGQEVYFFVRDGSVQHYFPRRDLIDADEAMAIAKSLINNGEISNVQLGILGEIPIFEVQIAVDELVHYLVINAKNREILMNFYL